MLSAWPLAGVHLGRLVARRERLREFGKRQAELVRADTLGFLAEEFLAEQIELLAERGVLALRSRQLGLQRRDEGPRRVEIVDRVRRDRHTRIIRESRSAYKVTPRVRTTGAAACGSDPCRQAAGADRRSGSRRASPRSRSATRTSRARAVCTGPRTLSDPTPGSSLDRRADSETRRDALAADPAPVAREPALRGRRWNAADRSCRWRRTRAPSAAASTWPSQHLHDLADQVGRHARRHAHVITTDQRDLD